MDESRTPKPLKRYAAPVMLTLGLSYHTVTAGFEFADSQIPDIAVFDLPRERFVARGFGTEASEQLPERISPKPKLVRGTYVIRRDNAQVRQGEPPHQKNCSLEGIFCMIVQVQKQIHR